MHFSLHWLQSEPSGPNLCTCCKCSVRLEEQSPRHDLVTNNIIVQPHSGGWLMAEGTEMLPALHPLCILEGVSLSFSWDRCYSVCQTWLYFSLTGSEALQNVWFIIFKSPCTSKAQSYSSFWLTDTSTGKCIDYSHIKLLLQPCMPLCWQTTCKTRYPRQYSLETKISSPHSKC